MVEPVNFTAGGDIHREIDLSKLASDLNRTERVEIKLPEDSPWQLIIQFNDGEGMILLYRTGKYIIRGGSSSDSLIKIKNEFLELMEKMGVIESYEDVSYTIQNIVFTEELDSEIDLNKAMIQLGLDRTEYEPEQFPCLIYRPEDSEVVVLIFSTGSIVVTGTTEEDTAATVISSLRRELSN
jgi:transcription initiation factor TFIID TATA-box-binding protein